MLSQCVDSVLFLSLAKFRVTVFNLRPANYIRVDNCGCFVSIRASINDTPGT